MKTFIVRKINGRCPSLRYVLETDTTGWVLISELQELKEFNLLFDLKVNLGERKRVLKRWGDRVVTHGEFITRKSQRVIRDKKLHDLLDDIIEHAYDGILLNPIDEVVKNIISITG